MLEKEAERAVETTTRQQPSEGRSRQGHQRRVMNFEGEVGEIISIRDGEDHHHHLRRPTPLELEISADQKV